jgi:hypothetical protein
VYGWLMHLGRWLAARTVSNGGCSQQSMQLLRIKQLMHEIFRGFVSRAGATFCHVPCTLNATSDWCPNVWRKGKNLGDYFPLPKGFGEGCQPSIYQVLRAAKFCRSGHSIACFLQVCCSQNVVLNESVQ